MLRTVRTRIAGTLLVPTAVLAVTLAGCAGGDEAAVRSGEQAATPTGSGAGGGDHTPAGEHAGAAADDGDHMTDDGDHAAGEHDHAAEEHAECATEGTVDEEGEHVDVTLTEWMIHLDPERVPAGVVDLHVENTGEEEHELLIVEGTMGDLPTDEHGALIEEELPRGTVVGEVEGVPSGKACDATFDLEPGTYAFVCNIVHRHDGEVESHLAEGMAAQVTIE